MTSRTAPERSGRAGRDLAASRFVRISGAGQHLLLALPTRGMPAILGWGAAHAAPTGSALALATPPLRVNGMDDAVPEAVLLPTGAMGRFGWPAIQGHRDGRDWTAEFGDWSVEREAEEPAAILRGRDAVASLSLEIRLAASDAGAWTMSTSLTNEGEASFALDRCMAATMLVPAAADRLFAFEGGWGREFQLAPQGLGAGTWLQESRRGRTSHDRFPAVFLAPCPDPFAPVAAACFGLHLGWSGNHVIAVERLEDGRRLVHAGELLEPGEMALWPGERYDSPAATFATGDDVAAVAAAFRSHVRRHVLRWPGGAMTARPVTLNTWEGTLFGHDLDNLKAQASAAAALGIERFVLDDGWFGCRDDDRSSLGDWQTDPRKYPGGLGPLVDHVTGLGMQFGLWFEPEMVSPDSELYRAHPDWALRVAGRPLLLSRGQLVLDLTREDAFEHVFVQMDALLSAHPIACIKWDMNRDLTGAGDAAGRAAASRQTRAAYALMDRIRAAHPSLEIESCASGGGRADYGVLTRTHRIWLSDCTDALERLSIQAGASLLFPPEIIGAHVSASPNGHSRRRHALAFRAIVAMIHHFGVELDPLSLAPDEAAELGRWIALHKRLRPLLHGAGSTSFRHAVVDGRHVYGVGDRSRIVIVVAQTGQMQRQRPDAVRVERAEPSPSWRVRALHPERPHFVRISKEQQAVLRGEVSFSAADLALVGLPVPELRPESAVILELEAMEAVDG